MKYIWKYVLIGLAVVAAEWLFVAAVTAFFNGLSQTEGVMIGIGFFLAFEMVICTGLILSKIEEQN